ncbi:MAG: hypothetical protein U1E15_05510 [Hyphomicrobiales bacterium]
MTDQDQPSSKPETVIDLDPDTVIEGRTDEATSPTPAPAPRNRMYYLVPLAALLIGAAGGGWLYRDVLASYLPSDRMAALQTRVDLLGKSSEDSATQLQSVMRLADQLKSDVDAIEAESAHHAEALKTASSETSATKANLQTLAADVEQLKQAVQALQVQPPEGTGTGSASTALPADVANRLAALEQDVAALKAQRGATPDKAVLTQVMADLRAKIASGAAFADEYDHIARLVPAAAGLDVLAPHAANGLPDAKGLADELAALKPSLPVAEAPAPADDSGWWASITGAVASVITIRDAGAIDWQQVADTAIALAGSGDLPKALVAIDQAEGEKPPALQQWRDRAAARIALEAAVAATAESVGRSLAAGP